jgi:hypothetical protein
MPAFKTNLCIGETYIPRILANSFRTTPHFLRRCRGRFVLSVCQRYHCHNARGWHQSRVRSERYEFQFSRDARPAPDSEAAPRSPTDAGRSDNTNQQNDNVTKSVAQAPFLQKKRRRRL